MMRLKFGRVVDLDHLEGVVTNRVAEELRGKLQKQQMEHERELAAIEVYNLYILCMYIHVHVAIHVHYT